MLISMVHEGGQMRLISKEDGERREELRDYEPYFYAVCGSPHEVRDMMELHPAVADARVEERFTDIKSRVKEPVVRIRTTHWGFGKVIRDMGKVPGVRELAETRIPHHFRFCLDNGLRFFDRKEELVLAAIGPDERIPECDVLFTWGGDSFLRRRKGVITSELGCFLRHCVHIDVRTDMEHDIYDESDLDDLLELGRERLVRVMELSRMCGVKPDIVSRVTPGKLNTFLHMREARKRGFIIPDIKKGAEEPKSLRLLQKMDKGGTIFYPTPGVYRDVAKCDFASMYPSIIVKYNISPETMHCTCGDDIIVPESGWSICRRRGLIPQGISEVLERRLELKRLKREAEGERRREYDLRQKALKNVLVTCFGYLAFRNFIFSNVETKECVMLYGRHILERTKCIAEEMGLDVVYGIVDSVFVKNGTGSEYRQFVKRVSDEIGIELELDCIFRAIAFPAAHDGSGIANKYYGITYDGEIEARGIALRHSDAPAFIKRFQEEAIRALLGGRGLDDVHGRYAEAVKVGGFALEEFSITKAIRKERYKVNAPHVVAYKQRPHGRHVTYVFTKDGPKPVQHASLEELDAVAYLRLLDMKRDELVSGLDIP